MKEFILYLICLWGTTSTEALTKKIQTEIDSYLAMLERQNGNNNLFYENKSGLIIVRFFVNDECSYIEFARLREYRDKKKYDMKEYQNHMNRQGYTFLMDNSIVQFLDSSSYNNITELQKDSILRIILPNVEEDPLVFISGDNYHTLVKICRDSIIRRPIYIPVKENVQKMKWEDFWKNRKY